MSNYISRNREIIYDDILEFEGSGMSDAQIAYALGLSRAGFKKIRDGMGWVRKHDSVRVDKGVKRIRSGMCIKCGVAVNSENVGTWGNGKVICRECL